MIKLLTTGAYGFPFGGSMFPKDLFSNFLVWLSHGFD
jgi:hypothetical protein